MIRVLKPYFGRKETGVVWLGKIPAHWEVRRLKSVCSQFALYGANVTANSYSPTGVRFIRTSDITKDGQLKVRGVFLPEELIQEYLLADGDILISRSGTIGRSFLYNSKKHGKCAYAGYLVRFVPDHNVLPDYLHFFSKSQAFADFLRLHAISSTIDNVNGEKYANSPISLPPIPEQTLIVRFLDHTDNSIQHYISTKQKLLALLEKQKQAIIQQSVTGHINVRTGKPYQAYKTSGVEWLGNVPEHWEIRRLRNVADMRVSNVDKHVKDDESPVRLCNYVDVYNNDYINKQMDFMHVTATIEEIERFRLERDDVLITKDSETWDDIGVPALVIEPACDLISGYHLALLRPRTDRLVGAYLLRALQSKGLAYQFHVEAKGVTRYGLSHAGIKSVWLPLPSLSEQIAIVHYLDEVLTNIETAINRMRRQIELFQEYRTRLIADVVTGKLDVREAAAKLPNDTESIDDHSVTGSINYAVSQVAG